ncbi:FliM/FliN family flagellar motor C-terminal domain-containing protein [Paracoccus sp. (in: a-proteobacteria)]|uniref:FliM/FliN family flagellar motor switch protein n=1 Tax=Paracoccus sp. TaxID=267 RepID=UPI0032209B19
MDSAATAQGATRNATGQAGQVLRRLIAHRRGADPANCPAPTGETDPDRAAGIALARAAERQARLPLLVEQVEWSQVSLAELPEVLPERALLAVIEGAGEGLGVVAICPDLLGSLIEMQAMGRITSRAIPARRPTRTDAAIASDFVDALLAELARELARCGARPDFGSYRYATYLDDPRPLALMLEDGMFARLSLRFRMGAGGQRDGRLMIALPGTRPAATARGTGLAGLPPPAPDAATATAVTLSEAVQAAPVALVGILCRRTMTLQALRRLVPGALLALPQDALDNAVVETAQGQLLARGRLGEANGLHAIRLQGAVLGTAPPRRDMAVVQPSARPAAAASPALSMPADLGEPDPFRSDPAPADMATLGLSAG